MKCQAVISIKGITSDHVRHRPFRRRYTVRDPAQKITAGRDLVRRLTAGGLDFEYTLEYCSGGLEWQIFEHGTAADLRERFGSGDSDESA